MHSTRPLAAYALLLAATGALPGRQPSAPPALAGRVTDAAGRAAPGAMVVARAHGRPITVAAFAGARGAFRLDRLPEGAWTLVARSADGADGDDVTVTVPSAERVTLRAGGAAAAATLASRHWLALLPDGEAKRKFLLDCTGCHQLDARIARPQGRARSEAEWAEAVTRMLGYAGARTGFPVIASDRDAAATARWLAGAVRAAPAPAPAPGDPSLAGAEITEWAMPVAEDLPHDVAVDAAGQVLVTGMFTHRIWRLDPARGTIGETPIPVERANPRAIEVDDQGCWWVVLGGPKQLAVHDPARDTWRAFDVGMYPHSLALGGDGRVWFNGHFTRDPELIGFVDTAGAVRTRALPPHPTLASDPAGPIPYEIRVAPDGRVWTSELQGGRVLAHDPRTGRTEVFALPGGAHVGPRRLDVAPDGSVWIPAYADGALLRLDPRTRRVERHALPVADAVPYVARVDRRTGHVWVGTSAGDVVLRFDPAARRFTTYPLPSRGALVRHLAVDAERGEVWIAYGASPGIPARIARLRPAPAAQIPSATADSAGRSASVGVPGGSSKRSGTER